jgi:hypothetical protein
MTIPLVAVVVIAVGLPLAAFWVGGRRFWGRLRGRSYAGERQGVLYRDMVRKHHLRPAEIAQVEGAVTWGRRLEDPRLRLAVVDWAQALRADADIRRAAHPRRRRLLLVLLVVWVGAVVTAIALGIGSRDWGGLARTLVYALVFGLPGYLAQRGPRRALELNSDPPTPSVGVLGE